MFQTEGGTSGTPSNAMRRPAAINMRADAKLSAIAAATASQPILGAEVTPPQNTFISWAPQPQLPVTTQGGADPTIHTIPSIWHVSTTDRSPALADMGALKSYLEYCCDSARRENAVQVLAQQSEEVLEAFAARIHGRVAELSASEAVEYQRARVLCVMDFRPPPPSRRDVRPGSREATGQLSASTVGAAGLGSVPMVVDVPAGAEESSREFEPQKKRLRFSKDIAGQDMGAWMSGSGIIQGDAEQQQANFALRNVSQDRLRVIAPVLQ